MDTYRFIGTGDDVNNCEHCNTRIKRAIIIEPIDADGNSEGDPMYVGTSCAAKLLNINTYQARLRAEIADYQARIAAEDAAISRRVAASEALPKLQFIVNVMEKKTVRPTGINDQFIATWSGKLHQAVSCFLPAEADDAAAEFTSAIQKTASEALSIVREYQAFARAAATHDSRVTV